MLFNSSASVKVTLHIKDDDGSPEMASFLITDGIERILDDSVNTILKADFPREQVYPLRYKSRFAGFKCGICSHLLILLSLKENYA